MAAIHPFRALRPRPAAASEVAAVPYDVVSTDEARALADGHPLSFLRVSRAELELPPGTDPHADDVYRRAVQNFERLKIVAMVVEDQPSLYVYRLTLGAHQQTGVAACFSLDEYEGGLIKKHERTRRDKEDDRTRHMLALGAQTGPVFLVYRNAPAVDVIVSGVTREPPLYEFDALDGVRHTLWRVCGGERDALVRAFGLVSPLYIADGHHRAASAARASHTMRDRAITTTSLVDDAGVETFLGVAFPHDQTQILAYNRVVKDLGSLTPTAFMDRVREGFSVTSGPATPAARGEIAMYVAHAWHTLRPRTPPDAADAIGSLDVSVLQDQLLEPILGIGDIRTDPRIDFIGGARGTDELERLVNTGAVAVAFSLYPVSVADLMAVSDEGAIMPPKSTWFEPKLRDGLLIHLL
jgi:uncharacterized protein (DUF1015 family)